MIFFRFRNQTKRINIRTQQRLDERMSHWLQKVFGLKNQIIGFKTQEGKFYDVESFYSSVEKFFGSTIQIIQSSDQFQISFTSQNLNSSSFIRPSQPSQINHQGPSSDDFEDFTIVADRKSFQKKITDGKDISVLFDTNIIYKKTLLQNSGSILVNPYLPFKTNLFMYINNSHPKKSCFSIYIGRTCLITMPLLKNYTQKIKSFISRYANSTILTERQNKLYLQARASHQQQDQAPSFTTYHLQQRLNQQTCIDYLAKMNKERLLRNYQYHKLIQKCEENFAQFYRIFCEGVMDNDYESFRNQILHKVQNNLELILSNVDEMDLSRPISRQEQRRNNLKKSVPEIQIVKVENYFEILDQLKGEIDNSIISDIKQLLLDEDKQICDVFSDYLAREISQQSLANRLSVSVLKRKPQTNRPASRYQPSRPIKSKSVDPIKRKFSEYKQHQEANFNHNLDRQQQQQNQNVFPQQSNAQDPPMFGSVRNEENFSPIKYMSDVEGTYKYAWNKLSSKGQEFEPEQYGLLYYYLQNKDDIINNYIQQLQWKEQETIQRLKKFLKEKISSIITDSFSNSEFNYLENNRTSPQIECIYQNFRYESDLTSFINGLKQEMEKKKPFFEEKVLHKKSSDSQLLDLKDKKNNRYGKRKFSDENQIQMNPRSPSPKDSEYSLNMKNSDLPNLIETIKQQWASEFEQMIKDINFTDERKQMHIREMYGAGNAEVFGWVRNYMKGQQQFFSAQQILQLKSNQVQRKFLLRILPIFDQFLRIFVDEGLLSDKARKWLISEFLQPNMNIVGSFEYYLETKNQQEFIQTLEMVYELQNKDMEFYNTYLKRLQTLLKQMAVHDEVGLQVFQMHPKIIKSLCQLYYISGDLEDMMDTLDVLYKKQTELRELNVATINFSGINTSPFQYHDGLEETTQLNEIFKKYLSRDCPDMKKWDIGKIDKDFQDMRQSVCYAEGFRICKDGKLPNKEEFEEIWRQNLKSAKFKKESPSEEQIKNCILMDYLVYLSVVEFTYKCQCNVEKLQDEIKSLNSKILLDYLNSKKNQPQCKIQVKQQIIIDYLLKNNIDVLFMQEAGTVNWGQELIHEYAWVKNSDSVIIYRKQKIGDIKIGLTQTFSKDLNFNNDSVCLFTTKNYLLISAHLKSGKEHLQQAKAMFETLDTVLSDHPLLKLVLGMDANHFIEQQKAPQQLKLRILPNKNDVPTTTKKRTFLQAQLAKADLQVSEVKDHIITNRTVERYSIEDIEGGQITNDNKQFVPNSRHPYDHFLVTALLK